MSPVSLPGNLFLDSKQCMRCRLILQAIKQYPELPDKQIYIEEMLKIENTINHLRQDAASLENEDPEKAKILYKELVNAACLDPHPYFWLIKYYQNEGQTQKIVRVCQTYIDHYNACIAMDIHYPEYRVFANVFSEMIHSYQNKQSR